MDHLHGGDVTRPFLKTRNMRGHLRVVRVAEDHVHICFLTFHWTRSLTKWSRQFPACGVRVRIKARFGLCHHWGVGQS